MKNLTYEKLKNPSTAVTEQLKGLWLECFCEEQLAAELIFDKYFDVFEPYAAKADGKIASALYLVSGSLNGKGAHYLCGAATLPEYRGQGIMTGLIEYALEDARKSGGKYSLLYPADEALYRFYSRLGYTAGCTAKRVKLTRQQLKDIYTDNRTDNRSLPAANYADLQEICFKNDYFKYSEKFLQFADEYYSVYGAKLLKGRDCLALMNEENGTADVIYSAYTDFNALKALLLNNTAAQDFVFTIKSDNEIFQKNKTEKYGMIKPLDADFEIPDDIYIGITLD